MKLNNTSYAHVTIRKLCFQLELLSGMKLVTDLSEEFDEIRFINSFGYIVIDYKRNACFTLSHKLDKKEMATIDDITLHCQWLEIGRKWTEERKRRNENAKK